MKKGSAVAVGLLSILSMNAYAVLPGFYMGLMLGPATNDGSAIGMQTADTPPTIVQATPTSQQFGTRLFMGYKSSQYFGAEGGLTYFSGIKYDAGDANLCSSANVRVRDFDFLGVGTYTFPSTGIGLYGKAGAALVYMTESGCMNPDLSQQCGKTTYSNQVKPAASVGVSYDMSQNWVIDASWNRLFVGSPVNNMDMYALGISYHFVDTYCGQFLCE